MRGQSGLDDFQQPAILVEVEKEEEKGEEEEEEEEFSSSAFFSISPSSPLQHTHTQQGRT